MKGRCSLCAAALLGALVPTAVAAAPAPRSPTTAEPASSDDAAARAPEGPELEGKTDRPVGALSNGGEDRGAFELGLGSVVMAVGVGLVVAGSVDLSRAVDRRRACSSFDTYDSSCDLDPPGLIYASSVLAFTFSVPAFVGASLLIHRGAKIHRDYRAVQRRAVKDGQMSFSLTPLAHRRRSVRGAMLGMRMRF